MSYIFFHSKSFSIYDSDDYFHCPQASDDKRSQKEIGDIAGVADVTIRQSYKLMYPFAAKLFPDDFKFSTPIEFLPQM